MRSLGEARIRGQKPRNHFRSRSYAKQGVGVLSQGKTASLSHRHQADSSKVIADSSLTKAFFQQTRSPDALAGMVYTKVQT